MGESVVEIALREQILQALADRTARNGGVMSRTELATFELDGKPRPLIDRGRGIRNPVWLGVTLSITSTPGGPYDDEEVNGGLLRYRYQGEGTEGDNRKLRAAAGTGSPLIFFKWIASGLYVPVFPVYVIADDPIDRSVLVALDESLRFMGDLGHPTEDQRRYAQRITQARLHQPVFRGRVITAYGKRCSICELKHPELLDAAHIVADGQPLGQPIVPNGMCLCKIHHAAYDENLLGVAPDFRVHVNRSLLLEKDGPMLKHGLQEMHGRLLAVPRRRADHPDRDRLALRFGEFRDAG